jgi:hypothetical protein
VGCMENGTKILDLVSDAHWDDSPGPQLLLPRDPPYRVFLGNLAHTLLGQPSPRVVISSRPAPYWRDVFVYRGLPWWALIESGLWHMVLIVVVLGVSKWTTGEKVQFQRFEHSSYITYYPPDPTFPASKSSRPSLPSQSTVSQKSAEPRPMRVAQQSASQTHALVAPPDIAEVTKRTELPKATVSGPVAPPMPISATAAAQLKGLDGAAAVVAPPPDVQKAASLGRGGMQMTVIAPPPEVQTASSRRGIGGPGRLEAAAVAPAPQLPMHAGLGGSGSAPAPVGGTSGLIVPPPPSVKRAGGFGMGSKGLGLSGSGLAAVPPAPSIQDARGSTGRGGLPGSSGLAAVPPAPSIEGAGAATARGGAGLAGGTGLAVVPPAPSLEGAAGAHGRRGGVGIGGGSGLAAVPPAPAVTGTRGAGGRNGKGFGAGSGFAVVPPAPSVAGSGGSGGRGGMGFGGSSLAAVGPAPSMEGEAGASGRGSRGFGGSSDFGAVPPAPSLDGAGGGTGRGGMGMGGGSGFGAVPPAPSLDGGAGSGGRGGTMLADSNPPVVPPPPSTDQATADATDPGLQTAVEELHMRIVGLAFATPNTSFASTYEVFIAERQLASHAVQLIKLVYWFLPYQPRLSEYHPDYSKMYKLRAKRDAACDESLMHLTVSLSGQTFSSAQLSTLSPGFPSGNRDVVLPCYRTTADDYRKALSHAH